MKEQTKKKLAYSIDLLRRSQDMALKFNPDIGFSLAFSGGKDSQVLYHVAKEAGVKFEPFFSPTSVDPPELISFIKRNYPDVRFFKLETSIYKSAMSSRHFTMPSRTMRWCCEEFKERHGAGTCTLIGIRREESARRSKRNEVESSNRKFSESFDQFSEHQEKMVTCVGGRDKILISPILYWTEEDVWDYLDSNGYPHCELYDEGRHRIGCILCPMSSVKEKLRDMERYPHVTKKWISVIETLLAGKMGEKEYFKGMTAEQVFKYWVSGLSIREFREKYIEPRLFSSEEIGEDKMDKLIKKAYETR